MEIGGNALKIVITLSLKTGDVLKSQTFLLKLMWNAYSDILNVANMHFQKLLVSTVNFVDMFMDVQNLAWLVLWAMTNQ